jgi:hypothetical protein
VRRCLICAFAAALALCPPAIRAQAPAAVAPQTDLDAFMARALQRRDVDRKTLSDYVLDESEEFEVLGPGRAPIARMRREYTWYVRDGMHVRSPLKFDGVPISEADRRAYEERWIKSESSRRAYRTKREEKRAAEGKPPAVSVPSINEPRFISESYFMDFKFEPGNYYLAGKETLDGHDVLKIDYLPSRLFDDSGDDHEPVDVTIGDAPDKDKGKSDQKKPDQKKPAKPDRRSDAERKKERDADEAFDRKMEKTSQVTLWVDPASHQIVKYTFNNVWLDFLPAGWLVRIDDLRANMQMGQPFPGVWLPHDISIHAGLTLALGSVELQYKRAFSNYRKADVSSRITVPKIPLPKHEETR